MSARIDYEMDGGESGYTGSYADNSGAWDMGGLSAADQYEAQKMTPYQTAAANTPWWQGAISYGLVKAIDNTFPGQQQNIQGNTGPGSFAGQNGRTYSQRGGQMAPPMLAGSGGTILGMPPLVVIGLGVAAYLALR